MIAVSIFYAGCAGPEAKPIPSLTGDKNHNCPVLKVKNGNIYFSTDGKNRKQLTNTGKDRSPVLSPDEKIVVFIRKSNNKAWMADEHELSNPPPPEELFADQLWIIDINDKKEEMLVKDWNPYTDEPKGSVPDGDAQTKVISHIDDVNFSPDGKKVYFTTDAWVTSNAVHSVNIDGSNEHFVVAGNSLKVIPTGEYAGYLIVKQHRYCVYGGSYDWFWVFTPEGEEVGPVGTKLENNCLNIEFEGNIVPPW